MHVIHLNITRKAFLCFLVAFLQRIRACVSSRWTPRTSGGCPVVRRQIKGSQNMLIQKKQTGKKVTNIKLHTSGDSTALHLFLRKKGIRLFNVRTFSVAKVLLALAQSFSKLESFSSAIACTNPNCTNSVGVKRYMNEENVRVIEPPIPLSKCETREPTCAQPATRRFGESTTNTTNSPAKPTNQTCCAFFFLFQLCFALAARAHQH